MSKYSLGIFALLSLMCLCSAKSLTTYEGYKVLRVKVVDREAAARLHQIGDDLGEFWSDLPERHADIMISPDNLETVSENLVKEGFEFSTLIENVADLMRLERIAHEDERTVLNADHPMTWTSYHSTTDINAYLSYLATTYPDLVALEVIGKSYEGADMTVVKICKGGCGNKPAMWIDGGIHAREWITPAVVTFMIRQLVEIQDPEEADLLDNLDWYILPVVNPDGYEYTRSGDRLWRKTRSKNGGLCRGADANRNYGYHFDDGGSSDSSCSETYHGPSAFSEVENQNIRDFVNAHKDQIKFFNTIHSYSQLVLLPWGFTSSPPPTYDKLFNLATKANAALEAVHGKSYEVGCIPCLLYVASGGSLDWALGEAGIPYSMAMELRDTGLYGFLLPPEQIIPTGEETWAFHKSAARQILEEFGAGEI